MPLAAAFYTFQNGFHVPPGFLQRTNPLALQFSPSWFSLLSLNSHQFVHIEHVREACASIGQRGRITPHLAYDMPIHSPTYCLSASEQNAPITQVQPVIYSNHRSLLNEQVTSDDYGWGCAICAV